MTPVPSLESALLDPMRDIVERAASCPSCGRSVFDEDAFCGCCGTPIRARNSDTGGSRRALALESTSTGDRETCGSCNSPMLSAEMFCSTCGARSNVDADGPEFEESWTALAERIAKSSLGKYTPMRLLGRGGMGIVFMARDEELERQVAIKVLAPSLLADEALVERFQREARTVASLRHSSIVSVYDVGRAGDLPYFVMDFIEGVSLGEVLQTFKPLPILVVEAILYQVGSALVYAHQPGREIVHRDVKPSNIMLDPEGQAVVMDFGISKAGETSSGLTLTGLATGTPEYMSPEQSRGHLVTSESDQYSLGAVLYAALTGAPPFTGPFYQVLMAHQTEPVPSILEVRPDCPPKLASAIERMLAKAPGERWSGIAEALASLELRPLPPDDPVLDQIGRLVEATVARQAEKKIRNQVEGDRTPTSLRIVPTPEGLEVGDEMGLHAWGLLPDGVEEAGLDVSWETTDPLIVQVQPRTGRLQAVSAGSAVIQAVAVGVRKAVVVNVTPPRVMSVTVEPDHVEVEVGRHVQLRARPRNKRNEPMDRPVTWSSGDSRTATVSTDGIVSCRAQGRATIHAYCEGVGAETVVEVVAAAPPRFSGSARTRGKVTVDGSGPSAPSPAATPSSHPRTGPFWKNRLVQRVGLGVAILAAALLAWIVVGAPPDVANIGIVTPTGEAVGPRLPLNAGDRMVLAASLSDEEGARLDRPVTWSSSDAAVATAGPDGAIVALSAGTTRITAESDGAVTEVEVTVRPEATAILLRTAESQQSVEEPLVLEVGRSVHLDAIVTDSDGAPVPGGEVSWSVSPPSVATVDPGGLVTAVAAGQGTVRATSADLESVVQITVAAPPAPPASGTIVVRIVPTWAYVLIDGVQQGEGAQSHQLSLPPGEHRLRLENPNMAPLDTVFTVRAGATTELRLRLSASDGP